MLRPDVWSVHYVDVESEGLDDGEGFQVRQNATGMGSQR